ncbi:MAG: radical SAM protein [Proteobacteria bacterium]|nr:radical SAM protein [Pseudomonadota bacterium]
MALKVNEIFHSLQGESTFTGMPCVFVRLSGCNLRCSYCDTGYAYAHGTLIDIEEIMDMVSHHACRLVEITGGEPLIQEETPALVKTLLDKDFTVLMETNGSMRIDLVDEKCIKIVDMKCPSSGESEKNDTENLKRLSAKDQLKFVIADKNDFHFAVAMVNQLNHKIPGGNILFSPVAGTLEPPRLAAWILENKLTVRFQIQLHKILWPNIDRGV